LILNITNYVVMNTTANALLAVGASPVMAHAIEEVVEMTSLASALVINIGTLSPLWVESMVLAGEEARRRGIPIVVDPVGCGATTYRTSVAKQLVHHLQPAVIRGNASEIRSLVRADGSTKGVDSRNTVDEVIDDAKTLSQSANCVVSVSGPEDLIVAGGRIARVANGVPMMAKVTGMGCTASAITAAFAATRSSCFDAAVNAMVTMGVAGEIAARSAAGPGSFQMHFLDALYRLDEAVIDALARIAGQMPAI
jgi:hydroxyethylthiazole kinase